MLPSNRDSQFCSRNFLLKHHGQIRGGWSAALAGDVQQHSGPESTKGVQCRQAASWRKFCPVADLLPDSIGPQRLVALLYWFSQLTGIQKAAAYTGCDRMTVGKIYNIIPSYFVAFLQKQNTQLLGSPRHICCVDECFLAKRKPSKQLRGRTTRPMRMLVVGIVELDRETKKETGRVVLRLVRNRSSWTLTNLVRSIVRPAWHHGCHRRMARL